MASGFVGTGNVDGSTPADAADWYAREGSVWGGTSGWTSRAAGGTGIARTVTLQLMAFGRWY